MPGFNYGNFGDGTRWSSERGFPPGYTGSTGNAGDNGGNSGGPNSYNANAVLNNPTVKNKLANMAAAARRIHPYAKLTVDSISLTGELTISVTELNVNQAQQIGLGGQLMGFNIAPIPLVVGNLKTGINIHDVKGQFNQNMTPASVDDIVSGTLGWSYNARNDTYHWSRDVAAGYTDIQIIAPFTFRLFSPLLRKDQFVDVTVHNGDPNTITKTFYNWKGPKGGFETDSTTMVKGFIDFKLTEERQQLAQAADILIMAGEHVNRTIGQNYRNVANEIASNIRNFQGKTIRNFEQASAALNRLFANPNMRINAGDRAALINALNHMNATDMAFRFSALTKTFQAADVAMKVQKAGQKFIEGLNTGRWTPLLLEIESWVASGMAAGLAMGLLSYYAPYLAAAFGLPVTPVIVIGLIGISVAASFIDDQLVNKVNNNVINALTW